MNLSIAVSRRRSRLRCGLFLMCILGGILAAPPDLHAAPQEQGPAPRAETARPGAAPMTAPAQVGLAELVAEAERVHPAIQAESRMIESKRARVSQAKALPDPTVSVGWMGNITPFEVQHLDPSSFRGITAMEQIPYPGKLKLRGQIAQKDVDAEQWGYEAVRRQVRAEVKATYYELWAVDQSLANTRKNQGLLEKLARIAEEKYKVGKGLQQDVLRSQLEVSRVLQRITVLEQRRRSLAARMNSLLLRPAESEIGPLAPVEKSGLTYSLDELIQKGVENSPEIQRQQQLIEQDQYAVNLAKRDYLPDFQVTYNYAQRPDLQDMHGFTFGINVPIFYRSKQRQVLRESASALESGRKTREAIRTELLFRIKDQYLQARASDELLKLYTRGLVPQSAFTLESSLAPYQTGSLDFESLISNFTAVLDYEIGYYEELAAYQKSLANLEVITGLELAK